jgi:hypothetical protein
MDKNHSHLGPCPQCGKPISATISMHNCGQDLLCCSEACGVAFVNSIRRHALEIEKASKDLMLAQYCLSDCISALLTTTKESRRSSQAPKCPQCGSEILKIYSWPGIKKKYSLTCCDCEAENHYEFFDDAIDAWRPKA